MNEETGITVIGVVWIVSVVLLAVLFIRHLFAQQNPPAQPKGPFQPE